MEIPAGLHATAWDAPLPWLRSVGLVVAFPRYGWAVLPLALN